MDGAGLHMAPIDAVYKIVNSRDHQIAAHLTLLHLTRLTVVCSHILEHGDHRLCGEAWSSAADEQKALVRFANAMETDLWITMDIIHVESVCVTDDECNKQRAGT